ncbi:MAG TPA: S-methyl-5-thioribose-1-phosphate isomerase [Polyangia bacterium]|jgi:methylthioribose-1-phosphate isomerase|nr:S-methyl-5-thioribose-1-phosphate isomerase [Polyangia bacterium]
MAAISLGPGQRPADHPGVLSPIFWRDDRVVMLDQRRLPDDEIWTAYDSWQDIARAIRDMEVRGAPAIGCAAAFGVALAWGEDPSPVAVRAVMKALGSTRPTAVNLGAALHRMANALTSERDPFAEARAVWSEDLAACRAIGAHGAALLPDDGFVLTHCNAGALATAGYGTALGVIRAAVAAGKRFRVLCDETRPWFQGARLTAWELRQDGIDCAVIVDGAAGHFLSSGKVGAVVVGADRITRRGDVANKIGTAGVAASSSVFGVPFVVAAPQTTVDASTDSGREIVIEERSGDEVARVGGRTVVPAGVPICNPVFDVTPSRLVGAIVTERGVFRPPYDFAERR